MKRLLLLPFLCLMPSAQAMDYVKCEAMQKALQRVENSRRHESTEGFKSNVRAMQIRECGPMPKFSDKQSAWYDCASAAYNGKPFDDLLILQKEAVALLDAKAKRIQADYDAEGCY